MGGKIHILSKNLLKKNSNMNFLHHLLPFPLDFKGHQSQHFGPEEKALIVCQDELKCQVWG